MNVLDKAIKFATVAHSGMFRKGTKIPYIVHPLETAAIAATMTVDEGVIAAAVLHDVIEDTPVTQAQLIIEFGSRIAELVCADSEDKRRDRSAAETWILRKQETLNYIPIASRDEQIVILSDKLSNMRLIYRDYKDYGDALWDKFNMKDKAKQGWYYGGIAERLDKVKDTHAYLEYSELVSKVFKNCQHEIDKSVIENRYNEETEQLKKRLERDFDVRNNGGAMDILFSGKAKNNTIKIDHYSWSEHSAYRFFDKEYVNEEIERSMESLIENELFRWDADYSKKALRKLIGLVHYDAELPSCSEWEDKKQFEQKALETLVKIVKSTGVLNVDDALNEVQKKLREAKLFENKKDIQVYERLEYELTECSVKEFNALKQELTEKNE